MSETKLTAKQEAFCREYIIDWNGAQAAIRSGYSVNTARQIAAENLTKPYIQTYIKDIQKDIAKIAGVSALRNQLELSKIAYSNVGNLRKSWKELTNFEDLTEIQKATIAEITVTTKRFGDDEECAITLENVKFKLHDKLKAIEMLNRMNGWNAPEKKEVNVKAKFSDWTEEQLEAEYERLTNK